MVKFVPASFLVLVVAIFMVNCESGPSEVTAAPEKTLEPCPPAEELKAVGCVCYPDVKYLICDGSKGYLSFKSRYEFDSLIIKNSPKLPFWSEHLSDREDFKVDTLVILQVDPAEVADNFNDLLSLPRKGIKVLANGQISSLDLSNLQSSLTSISVSNVPDLKHTFFTHFVFGEDTTLEHLQFREVLFNPEIKNLFLEKLPLNRIEIISSALSGTFGFVPKNCSPDEKIIIDLRDNLLTGFNFTYLFPEKLNTCQYHIDLSGNEHLNPKLLINELATLKAHGKQMFIRLNNVKVDCNCELYRLYKSDLTNSLHTVDCNDFGFIDQITDANHTICRQTTPDGF